MCNLLHGHRVLLSWTGRAVPIGMVAASSAPVPQPLRHGVPFHMAVAAPPLRTTVKARWKWRTWRKRPPRYPQHPPRVYGAAFPQTLEPIPRPPSTQPRCRIGTVPARPGPAACTSSTALASTPADDHVHPPRETSPRPRCRHGGDRLFAEHAAATKSRAAYLNHLNRGSVSRRGRATSAVQLH